MRELLEELRCATCHTVNALWLDPVRALVECRACGQIALIVLDVNEGRFT
ncbi:hypothetical protein LDL08_11640 [Nonomuraea glycinis]|jgi:hypothetical protein|uniref:Uncharacterized protein n=1 Tax=Nonomuraea glycinis TaxID=2047744 RepID=A0A918E4B3_9ACTN|nr:hypothetical protein [Nonomuraea glycinis]MCA2176838.1 hypothetical protein [Nonomuraea glycinis]GGP03209.1 hypothetical protein GCM10012278_13510 [Nonomuraea glycinis]